MTNALREELGKVAYAAFYCSKYTDWDLASEASREAWRTAAEATAVATIILTTDATLKSFVRDQDIAPVHAEHQQV